MKFRIFNHKVTMAKSDFEKHYEDVIKDNSEMQDFIRFLSDYVHVASIAGEACKGALVLKLREQL